MPTFDSLREIKKCLTYTRVSNEEQTERLYSSCDAQTSMCLELIEKHRQDGWVPHITISDPGYSAGTLNRPGIREMIRLVQKKEVQVIVAYRRDRLFRDTKDSTAMQAFFDLNNITVTTVVEGIYDQSPHAKFARLVIDGASELERLVDIGRIRDKLRKEAEQGLWKGGFAPFGYSYTPGTRVLARNDVEAPIIRYIFASLADGVSLADLCEDLRRRELFGRNGKYRKTDGTLVCRPSRFRSDTIRRIILSPIYRGYMRVRNPDLPEGASDSTADAWLLYKGKHEPLVEEDVWFRANRALPAADSARSLPKNRPCGTPLSFLAGVTRCAECSAAMTPASARRKRKNGDPSRYLRCTNNTKSAEASTCKTKSISADAAEGAVLAFVNAAAEDGAALMQLEERSRLANHNARIGALKKELMAIEERIQTRDVEISRLVNFVKEGGAASMVPEMTRAAETAHADCERLKLERARIEGLLARAGARYPTREVLLDAFRRVAAGLVLGDIKVRRDIVHQIFKSITIRRIAAALLGGAVVTKRTYRFQMHVSTSRLLAFGEKGISELTHRSNYADLEFTITIEVHSNSETQRIYIIEMNYNVLTCDFRSTQDNLLPTKMPAEENPVQRARRWHCLIESGESTALAISQAEKVSKASISQHRSLMRLPRRILSFLQEGRDSSMSRRFSARELLRILKMPPEEAEHYFLARIGERGLQGELKL